MLQSLLRQPLGRLNVTRGMVGLSRLPLYANITRGLLTSAPALKEADTSVTKVREVKKKTKAKKVVPKKPKRTFSFVFRLLVRWILTQSYLFFLHMLPFWISRDFNCILWMIVYKKDVVRPDSIRRPLYGFAKFVRELREKSGSTDSLKALFGEASPKWHALSEQEKQVCTHAEYVRFGVTDHKVVEIRLWSWRDEILQREDPWMALVTQQQRAQSSWSQNQSYPPSNVSIPNVSLDMVMLL